MSLLSMPFLILNYGGEMIYILEQRLHSQQIKLEKSQKVLHDLTRALFSDALVEELFKPQAIISMSQAWDVCDKLAQSSIMKLSSDSMDKLFDLVVMGVKYQVLAVRHPCELIDVTLNHIDYILNLVKSSASTTALVEKARETFVTFAKGLGVSEFAEIRQTLLDFAIKKRVKVSLFLQEKMQHSDGRFVLPQGGPLPNEASVQMPGTIKYEDGTQETFDYQLASQMLPKLGGNPYNPETRDCTLGQNFYTVDRKKTSSEPKNNPPPEHGNVGSTKAAVTMQRSGNKIHSAGTAELNSLGSLLGVTSAPASSFFRVALFGDQNESSGTATSQTELINIPRMTREELVKHNPELAQVMAGLDISDPDSKSGGAVTQGLGDLYDLISDP